MPKKYKITSGGTAPDGADLVDCHIEEKADGSGYELVAKRVVLATSNTTSPPFTFSFNNYDGWNWTVTVDSILPASASGTWTNTDGHTASTNEADSWTASGAGVDPDDAEAKSASAK